jgi:hypothetical protein
MLEIAILLVALWIGWKVYKGSTNSKEEVRLQLMIDAAERRGNTALVGELRKIKPLISSNYVLYVRALAAIEDRANIAAQAAAQTAPVVSAPSREEEERKVRQAELGPAEEAIGKARSYREQAFAALDSGDRKGACAGMMRGFVPAAMAARVWLRELQITVKEQAGVKGASPEMIEVFRRQLVIGTGVAVRAVMESYITAVTAASILGETTPNPTLDGIDELKAMATREVRLGAGQAMGRHLTSLLHLADRIIDLTAPAIAGLTDEDISAEQMQLRLASVADGLGSPLRDLRIANYVFDRLGSPT